MAIPWSRSGASALPIGEMERRIEIALQRQHHHRDLRLRVDDQERHEHAVVEAALGVLADLQMPAAAMRSLTSAAISGAPGAGYLS